MSRSKRQLGVGIIGSGFMGQTYAKTVRDFVEGAQVVAVSGGSRARKLAGDYGVACLDSYEALVARDDIDLVCVATPHACHGEQAIAAAEAGKHLLIDKPMACSVEDCDAILAACRARNLRSSVTFTQRYRIGFAQALEALGRGELGRVLEIRTWQLVPEGMGVVPAWQMQPENVGLLLGHGVHNLDAVRCLTGREIASVFAKCRTLGGAPVEGTSDLLVTTADGGVQGCALCVCFVRAGEARFPAERLRNAGCVRARPRGY